MKRVSKKHLALVSILCVAIAFLIWWRWSRPAVEDQASPAPLPQDITAQPQAPIDAEPGEFQEVKLPNGETGLAPRLSGQQLEKIQKGGTVTLSAPGGGVITISQPSEDQRKKALPK